MSTTTTHTAQPLTHNHSPVNNYSLRLNKSIDMWCNGKPVMGWSGLTVGQAAQCLAQVADDLGPFLVAKARVYRDIDGIPAVEEQVAKMRRRLDKLAKLIGRAVVRYEFDNVSNVHFYLSR